MSAERLGRVRNRIAAQTVNTHHAGTMRGVAGLDDHVCGSLKQAERTHVQIGRMIGMKRTDKARAQANATRKKETATPRAATNRATLKREARHAIREAFPLVLARRRKAETRKRLIPGLKDRLITTLQNVSDLNSSLLGEDLFVEYLASTTGTAIQTARRWIAETRPGLPDLVSFTMLCDVLQADVNWMLGLTQTRLSLPRGEADWLQELMDEFVEAAGSRRGEQVQSDEMEPLIMAGDWVLVDKAERRWGSGGIYLFEWKGRRVLRSVEIRIGEGFVLRCANKKYAETRLRDEAHAKTRGIRLIGRVVGRISLTRI